MVRPSGHVNNPYGAIFVQSRSVAYGMNEHRLSRPCHFSTTISQSARMPIMILNETIDALNRQQRFLLFQLTGWFVVGFTLFVSGLGHQSILASATRNSLFAVLGLGLSYGLRFLFGEIWKRFRSPLISGISIFALSYACGLISGLILNPITFYAFHGGLGSEPLRALFAGVLNFAFVFTIWSLCYVALSQFARQPAAQTEGEQHYLKRLSVEQNKHIFPLPVESITYIESDSDYIKIHANNRTYLQRKTLREIEASLDPQIFQRIHRSWIINVNFVEALKPHLNGDYFVILKDKTRLKMSRNYKHVLKTHFGSGV